LSLDSLENAGQLEVQLAKQSDYGRKIEVRLERKKALYERFVLREISMEDL